MVFFRRPIFPNLVNARNLGFIVTTPTHAALVNQLTCNNSSVELKYNFKKATFCNLHQFLRDGKCIVFNNCGNVDNKPDQINFIALENRKYYK